MFWPGKDEESARRNLRQSLYNLRSLFPRGKPAVARHVARRSSSIADLDAWIDVHAFEQALERGGTNGAADLRIDTHRLSEAVSLYRGDFLQGFQVKDSDEFEYWLAAEQERLREKAVAALRLLIDSYLERGEHRAGIQYAQRLVAIDPLSEDAHQKLMRLYALSGRRSRALAQYEDLAEVLRRELDVSPMPETTALQQRILRQESSYPAGSGSGEEGGPVIPMAGRDSAVRAARAQHAVGARRQDPPELRRRRARRRQDASHPLAARRAQLAAGHAGAQGHLPRRAARELPAALGRAAQRCSSRAS